MASVLPSGLNARAEAEPGMPIGEPI